MKGYWNRDADSCGVDSDGWLHSGDLARRDEAGDYYLVDRIKDIINVSGLKVFLAEVERVLASHPAVSDAGVFGLPDPLFGERVFAKVVLHRGQSLRTEELAAVYMSRSVELPVVLLAVLKAGFAYVPLDVEYPPDRLRYMVEDSQAALLLASQAPPDWAETTATKVIEISDAELAAATESGDNLGLNVAADALAYVIYTSGSTGRPKGAMNTHGGISNRLLWMQDQYALTEDDRVLQKTPIGFDVSVWELFWPWIAGAGW